MRLVQISLVVVATIAIAACSTPAADMKPAAAVAVSPPATGTPWNPSPDQVGVGIGDVSPQKLVTSGNQIAAQIISVPYRIPHPENVTAAALKLYVKEIGDIATMPVTPMENGVAQFAIEPSSHSLGPTVRFRASCPKGVTDWHTLGQIPFDYDTRMADVFRIGSVSPDSIRWSPAMDGESGAGQRVTIWGPTLGAGCRIEAQVNGRDIELNNVMFQGRQYQGLLMYRDIDYHIVSPRYAELKLSVTRGEKRLGAIQRLAIE
jgi:hypothetical protein